MTEEEIREAVEATSPSPGREGQVGGRRVANDAEVALHVRALLSGIEELDPEVTVQEIREALE